MEHSNTGIVFREVHKNGWLRCTDGTEKEGTRLWVVFCVHDDIEPQLEGYVDQKQAASHSSLWHSSLKNALHLSPTLCATVHRDFEFCVNFCDHKALRLAAPTYQDMHDWVQTISRKLTDMKILSPKENLYSKGPGTDRLPTRDPTSPLPLPPRPLLSFRLNSQATVLNSESELFLNIHQPQVTEPEFTATSVIHPIQSNQLNRPNQPEHTTTPNPVHRSEALPNFFTFDNIPNDNVHSVRSTQPRFIPIDNNDRNTENTSNFNNNNSSYESLFLASSYSPTRPDRSNNSQGLESTHYAALREYRSEPAVTQHQPSRTRRAMDREETGRPLTLREQQVLQLKREMSHVAGVRLQLRRRDCKDDVALVDTFGAVWVAGWKQREHPMLYNALHIGDQVLSLAGTLIHTASAAREILKSCTTPYVEMIVRRLPQGRTMTLIRETGHENDSEGFGLQLHGNEVTRVGDTALALGFPPAASAADPSMAVGTMVTWTLTEVNGRPLNLLGLGGGACERLGAIGLDISVVVQPTDLVFSLQKRLRSFRGYKNYVLN